MEIGRIMFNIQNYITVTMFMVIVATILNFH